MHSPGSNDNYKINFEYILASNSVLCLPHQMEMLPLLDIYQQDFSEKEVGASKNTSYSL